MDEVEEILLVTILGSVLFGGLWWLLWISGKVAGESALELHIDRMAVDDGHALQRHAAGHCDHKKCPYCGIGQGGM